MNQPAHSFTSDAHAEARRQFEARKLTQDGAIWPVRREEMRHGPTLRERMVEDLHFRLPDSGFHTMGTALWALCTLGWTADQIATHGERATNDFRAAQPDKLVRAKP